MTQTKISTDIRNHFGLTQAELSHYLKISRSQLNMYESGKRELPMDAIVKLAEMEQFITNHQTKKKFDQLPHEIMQAEKAQQFLELYNEQQEYNKLLTAQKLKKLEKNYNQKTNLLRWLQQTSSDSKKTLEKNWKQLLEFEALQSIEKNGLHQQLKLELELQSATMIQKHIELLKKQN